MDGDKEKLQIQYQSGRDEMNLVEFPITLLSKRRITDVKTIKFSDTVVGDDNKPIKREWIITGSDEFGLPLAYDNDVLIALMLIGKENDFSSPVISFSRYRLCKIMSWKIDGRSYKRIEDALNRLLGVSIYAKKAFWDNERKDLVTLGFGIIDSFTLYDSSRGRFLGEESFPLSSVELNKYIYNSIKSGYIKSLDLELYFNLRSAISKRLYRYLDKKRHGRRKIDINLFNLAYTHLGLDMETYKYTSDIKKKLNLAHDELIKAKFLYSADYISAHERSMERVLYTFERSAELPDDSSLYIDDEQVLGEIEELYNRQEEELLKLLVKNGVTEAVARQLIRDYPLHRIDMQIKALPFRKANEPGAVLLRSIQEDWSLPASYQECIEKEQEKRIRIQRNEEEAMIKNKRRKKVEDYIANLSRSDLAVLMREARKLAQKEGGTLFKNKEMPPHIVKAYLYMLVEKQLNL